MKPILIQDHKANTLINQQLKELLSSYYFPGGTIEGKRIISFSQHKQINLFILFQIYQDWSGQVNEMVHPYFDFSHEEVKNALKNFQNVLSRHILVKKEDFAPLVEKAVYNTLRLITDPVDTLNKFFFKSSERIPLALFQKHASYFSDFDFAIQSISKYYEKNEINVVEKEDFFLKFEKVIGIFEKKEDSEIRDYQEKLFEKAFGESLESYLAVPAKGGASLEARPEVRTPVFKYNRPEPNPKRHYPPLTPEETGAKSEPKPEAKKEEPSARIEIKPQPEEKKISEEPKTPPVSNQVQTPATPPVTEKKEDLPPAVEPPKAEERKQEPQIQSRPLYSAPEEEKPVFAPVPPRNEEVKKDVPAQPRPLYSQPEAEKPVFAPVPPKNEDEKQEAPVQPKPLYSQPEAEKPVFAPVPPKEEPQTPAAEEQEEAVFELHTRQPEKERSSAPIDLFSTLDEEEGPVFGSGNNQPTLADKLKHSSGNGNLHQSISGGSGGAKKLSEAIPVHKQFQFVQKLFGGSSVKFKVVLEKLQEAPNFSEAEGVLNRYVFNNPEVNSETKLAQEFIELVKGQF
ncbi:MAG: hypothetical protein H6581_23185 [Bacteroidia bacterium]|nr:hypothetical protein [Bacteroidia bacterium]